MRLTTLPTRVRPATAADAIALHALSAPFIRSGELRRRTAADYLGTADEFLVIPGDGRDGEDLDGCVALRVLAPEPGHPAAGVLYNFCVRPGRQGLGLGSRLLTGLLAEAAGQRLRTVYAATSGSGALFRQDGFREVPTGLAPRSWTAGLDPARGSRVHRRTLSPPKAV